MDTKGQFACFALSIVIGFAGGLLYEPFAFFRFLLGHSRKKMQQIGIILDIIYGIAFAGLCIAASFFLQFPEFRWYMALGWAVGLTIYIKTLRIIVAFFEEVCYNGIAKVVKRAKNRKNSSKRIKNSEREDLDI